VNVSNQIKVRMDQLKMPVTELAKRCGVSNQSVRHWLNGRSYPGKAKIPDLERALSFKLDFSEGAPAAGQTVEATLEQQDISIFIAITKLPPNVKTLFHQLAVAFTLQAR
jgi:transcriptional regulator with XRE-family HTH domain